MKTLAVLLLLATALPAAAQQPRITQFTADGGLTWTNPPAATVCRVDWAMDLNWSWLPWTEEMQITSAVSSVKLDFSVFDGLDSVLPQLDQMLDSLFFRVICSTSSLPEIITANNVRVLNASTSVLTQVSMWEGREFDQTPVTNFNDLAISEATPRMTISHPFNTDHNWYVYYTQDGVERDAMYVLFEWGPPEKNITLIISNDCYLLDFEYLGAQWKVNY